MSTSIRSKSIVAILVAAAIAPAAPAVASVYEPVTAGYQPARSHDSSGVTLRRDGSQATPLVADRSPQGTAAGDGFDWADAAIGAGAGLLGASIAMLGSAAVTDRRRASKPPTAVSQGV